MTRRGQVRSTLTTVAGVLLVILFFGLMFLAALGGVR